ncbi:MAG: TM2 domain-containing protein [Saprospiraceae bacterium]|nr:TM2 domain-containing protein [Saprospiraceae bacterium]
MRPKNRITAAFLAFFTGIVGGHKLYLGDTGGFIFLWFYSSSASTSLVFPFPCCLVFLKVYVFSIPATRTLTANSTAVMSSAEIPA